MKGDVVLIFSGGSILSVWGAVGAWFLVGGIQSEQLQVSYYDLYYASLWF